MCLHNYEMQKVAHGLCNFCSSILLTRISVLYILRDSFIYGVMWLVASCMIHVCMTTILNTRKNVLTNKEKFLHQILK